MVKGSSDTWARAVASGKAMSHIAFESAGVKHTGLSLAPFVPSVTLGWSLISSGIGLLGCKVEVRRCLTALLQECSSTCSRFSVSVCEEGLGSWVRLSCCVGETAEEAPEWSRVARRREWLGSGRLDGLFSRGQWVEKGALRGVWEVGSVKQMGYKEGAVEGDGWGSWEGYVCVCVGCMYSCVEHLCVLMVTPAGDSAVSSASETSRRQ